MDFSWGRDEAYAQFSHAFAHSSSPGEDAKIMEDNYHLLHGGNFDDISDLCGRRIAMWERRKRVKK